MKFAIAVLRQAIQPDIRCLELVRFYWDKKDPASLHPIYFNSLVDARAQKSILERDPYIPGPDELCRPEYVIVTHITADYIKSRRYDNNENYHWSKCGCERNNGQPCRECGECMRFRIDSDRQYIYNNQLEGY